MSISIYLLFHSFHHRQEQYINQLLTDKQKKKVQLLVDTISELPQNEKDYLRNLINDQVYNMLAIQFDQKTAQWPILLQNTFPISLKDQKKAIENVQKLWDGSITTEIKSIGGGSGGQAIAQTNQEVGKGEEQAKEEVLEKTSFDIELTAFDAANKIKIIKEFRTIFKLQLKEAKDLVEKAPTGVAKNISKDEAQKLKEKLEGLGCQITLL